MSHLVLIVMTLLILFESCLWISGLPLTLICFLEPRRSTKATLAKRPSKGSQAPDEVQTQNKVLSSPEEVLVTLRLQVDSCRPAELSAFIQILLSGTPVSCSNRQLWVHLVNPDGSHQSGDFVALCRGLAPFPVKI